MKQTLPLSSGSSLFYKSVVPTHPLQAVVLETPSRVNALRPKALVVVPADFDANDDIQKSVSKIITTLSPYYRFHCVQMLRHSDSLEGLQVKTLASAFTPNTSEPLTSQSLSEFEFAICALPENQSATFKSYIPMTWSISYKVDSKSHNPAIALSGTFEQKHHTVSIDFSAATLAIHLLNIIYRYPSLKDRPSLPTEINAPLVSVLMPLQPGMGSLKPFCDAMILQNYARLEITFIAPTDVSEKDRLEARNAMATLITKRVHCRLLTSEKSSSDSFGVLKDGVDASNGQWISVFDPTHYPEANYFSSFIEKLEKSNGAVWYPEKRKIKSSGLIVRNTEEFTSQLQTPATPHCTFSGTLKSI